MRGLMTVLRGYGSAALLAAAAIVLLAIGSPSKAAIAGAGFAFFGAAVARGIDIARERQTAASLAAEARRRDLDETRRLAIAMLLKRPAERDPVLTATVVNALAYHGLGVDPEEAMSQLALADRGSRDSVRWLQEKIDLINEQLNPEARVSAGTSATGKSRPDTTPPDAPSPTPGPP